MECKLHSGIMSDIEHLQRSDAAQWKEIKGMRKVAFILMGSVIATLMGVLINIAITLNGG